MARHAALAACFARLLAGPLVRCSLLMRRLPTLARNIALLTSVHRSESTILFCHGTSYPGCWSPGFSRVPDAAGERYHTRAATEMPRNPCNPQKNKHLRKRFLLNTRARRTRDGKRFARQAQPVQIQRVAGVEKQ